MSSSLALALAAVLVLVALALVYYAFRIEPNWLDVRRVEIALPRLPAGLDGFTIGQLSDLHVHEGGAPDVLRRAIAAVDSARPDLVVITGDLVDRGYEIDEAIALLKTLSTRPAYAIFGNHDYGVGEGRPRVLARALESLGIVVLRNQAVPLEWRGHRLWIVGVDDPCTERDDLAKATAELGPDDYPRLLLTHTPKTIYELGPGEADLALAGHTHGGQIFVPILTALVLSRIYSRYSHGLYFVGDTALYVSRGLGSIALPARFLRRPEVTLLTLRARPDA